MGDGVAEEVAGNRAVEAIGLTTTIGDRAVVDGVDLSVPTGSIVGLLGPNGAGKTTLIRTLLGILDPSDGERRLLGSTRPLEVAARVGYMPEERGLYPAMRAVEAIAFMGCLRGLPLAEGRRRARRLLEEHALGEAAEKPIRALSKGMAQTVQLIGTIVHEPDLLVLDEPFSGLDAINQERLEGTIRAQAARGATVLFSTHVIAHAERLCERVAIIAGGRMRFAGTVDEARERLPSQVRLHAAGGGGRWRSLLPADAQVDGAHVAFPLPDDGIEPLLAALIAEGSRIDSISIERPGLHDAFVRIVGDAA